MIEQAYTLEIGQCLPFFFPREYPQHASEGRLIAQTTRQNVLDHRETLDDIELLKHHADFPAQQTQLLGVELQNIGLSAVDTKTGQRARHQDRTRARLDEAVHATE